MSQEVTRESQVEQQMNELCKAINDLRATKTAMVERLAKVSTLPSHIATWETSGEEQNLVPLAADLRGCVREIQEITSQFNEILGRLEL